MRDLGWRKDSDIVNGCGKKYIKGEIAKKEGWENNG